jgi:hypothetical protein
MSTSQFNTYYCLDMCHRDVSVTAFASRMHHKMRVSVGRGNTFPSLSYHLRSITCDRRQIGVHLVEEASIELCSGRP